MAGPVQHITSFVAVMDGTGDSTGGLNTDRPAGHENAWPDGVTDPSTNNEVDGPGLIRNQFVDGTLKNRTLRDGGSGRPQYRRPGSVECVRRRYGIRAEDDFVFYVQTTDLPLNSTDFVAIMVSAGINFTANDAQWVMTDHLLDQDEINDLAATDSGWVSAGATCTSTSDLECV